jgi:hypothetical protein
MDGLKGPPHVWHPCQSYVVPTHKKKKKQVKDVDKKTLVQKTYEE